MTISMLSVRQRKCTDMNNTSVIAIISVFLSSVAYSSTHNVFFRYRSVAHSDEEILMTGGAPLEFYPQI